jgi:hypothetical protein
MRRRSTIRWYAWTLTLVSLVSQSRAQEPGFPKRPETRERSGLITRYNPVVGRLPHDLDRDDYFVTRWSPPNLQNPNCYKDGGLYGLKWNANCVACDTPFFRGYPGANCVDGQACAPVPRTHRLWENFIHPWKPVDYYYGGGCSVPVYDLDPLVTGPGPFPWNTLFKRPTGG